MAGREGLGLYQITLKGGAKSPVWRTRMAVPADVRAILGRREWDVSLQTDSATEAARRARDHLAAWKREIALARGANSAAKIDLDDARVRIGSVAWAGWIAHHLGEEDIRPAAWRVDPALADLYTPAATSLRIATLRRSLERGEWMLVSDLARVTSDVLRLARIEAHASHPQFDALTRIVAETWLASLEAEERDRLLRATVARTAELRDLAQSAAIVVPATLASPTQYQPQAGDKTVGDLIAAYRRAKTAEAGEREADKRYTHIYAALEEVLGRDTVLRTITREDCRRVRDFLRRVPVNAAKIYRGLTLAQAIERADQDDAPRISESTVGAYLINLSAVMNWAVREEWISKNPAQGLAIKGQASVKRRGFTVSELQTLFGHLEKYRQKEAWKWWVAVIGLYAGARLNEIVQLRRTDLRTHDGIHYLALTVYDETGRKSDKTLKTASSERNVPIHPELIRLGLLKLGEGSGEMLLPGLPGGVRGSSLAVSKWFGRELEGAGLSDPSLVFHSFRHGFRDACEQAGISDRLTKALGGWATQDVSQKYGNRGHLPTLAAAISKIGYGEFRL